MRATTSDIGAVQVDILADRDDDLAGLWAATSRFSLLARLSQAIAMNNSST